MPKEPSDAVSKWRKKGCAKDKRGKSEEEKEGWSYWVIAIIILIIVIIIGCIVYWYYYSGNEKGKECEDTSKKDEKLITPSQGIMDLCTYREWTKNGYNCSNSSANSSSRSAGGPYAYIDEFK